LLTELCPFSQSPEADQNETSIGPCIPRLEPEPHIGAVAVKIEGFDVHYFVSFGIAYESGLVGGRKEV
jgi:hypothetical protein